MKVKYVEKTCKNGENGLLLKYYLVYPYNVYNNDEGCYEFNKKSFRMSKYF